LGARKKTRLGSEKKNYGWEREKKLGLGARKKVRLGSEKKS
jgi:hypothetical protein